LRHRIPLLVTSALLGFGACTSPMASPTGPHLLDGDWRTAPAVPSGSGIHLSLATSGPFVTGTGEQSAIQYIKYTFIITGQEVSDGTFRLTFTSDSGTVATHSGHMVGSDEFRIEWGQAPCPTSTCGPDSLTFARAP
jgi:hypothetical protein